MLVCESGVNDRFPTINDDIGVNILVALSGGRTKDTDNFPQSLALGVGENFHTLAGRLALF